MKVGLLLRFKFAWKAFTLQPMQHTFPYEYNCKLIPNAGVCDNNRRISTCLNAATIALKNPAFIIELKQAQWDYHVCKKCADKYIGTMDGEKFEL